MDTERGLRLERLRRHAQDEIHAVRCDPALSDEEKTGRIASVRQEHAARARAVIDGEGVRRELEPYA